MKEIEQKFLRIVLEKSFEDFPHFDGERRLIMKILANNHFFLENAVFGDEGKGL